MRATRQRDTPAELALRRILHRRGLRFLVDRTPIPAVRSRADILFRGARVAVFVDGCFWHGCPTHGTLPKKNREWWRAKLLANKARDARVDAALTAAGWLSLRIWEHEDPGDAAKRVARHVAERTAGGVH
jgi:DNA mismatch endonuclease (patch repair protein)